MESLRVREYENSDKEHVFKLINQIRNDVVTLQAYEEEERQNHAQMSYYKKLIGEVNGSIVAFGFVAIQPNMVSGSGNVGVVVDNSHRNQGYGTDMLDAVLKIADRQNVKTLFARMVDTDESSRAWADKRGFEFDAHAFESVLDLENTEVATLESRLESIATAGMRIQSMSELGTSEENSLRLYRLWGPLIMQQPGMKKLYASYPTFEQFQTTVVLAPQLSPSRIFIAVTPGEKWVGLGFLLCETTDEFFHGFTGVMEDYRRKGIATALKCSMIVYAKSQGIRQLRTSNNSENKPMLAINKKLGYVPQAGMIRVKKQLA